MSDKRIIDLEAKQTLGSGDYLAADSAQGTYKVDANTNIMTPLANVRNNVANSSASPDKYSTSTAYKVGDMVIHDDILYKCTTACSAASWAVNSACFTAKTLASVVTQLNNDLTSISSNLNEYVNLSDKLAVNNNITHYLSLVKFGQFVRLQGLFSVNNELPLNTKWLYLNSTKVYPKDSNVRIGLISIGTQSSNNTSFAAKGSNYFINDGNKLAVGTYFVDSWWKVSDI